MGEIVLGSALRAACDLSDAHVMIGEEPGCFFVGRREGPRLTLLSMNLAHEGRAVLVFRETLAAEAFRVIEGLSSEWEVIGHTSPEAAELLVSCAAGGTRYVAPDPPSALTRGHEEPRVVSIRGFIERFADWVDSL